MGTGQRSSTIPAIARALGLWCARWMVRFVRKHQALTFIAAAIVLVFALHWGTIVATVVGATGTWFLVVWMPTGPERFFRWELSAVLVYLALSDKIALASMVVIALLAWRERRRRLTRRGVRESHVEGAASAWYVVISYLFLLLIVASCEWTLTYLHTAMERIPANAQIDATPVMSVVGIETRLARWTILFIAAQISISLALRCISRSLQSDWVVAPNSAHRRLVLLALGTFPIVVAGYTAAHPPQLGDGLATDGQPSLVAGVAARFATLIAAWYLTGPYQRDRDANFLSWGLIRTTLAAIRREKAPPTDGWFLRLRRGARELGDGLGLRARDIRAGATARLLGISMLARVHAVIATWYGEVKMLGVRLDRWSTQGELPPAEPSS